MSQVMGLRHHLTLNSLITVLALTSSQGAMATCISNELSTFVARESRLNALGRVSLPMKELLEKGQAVRESQIRIHNPVHDAYFLLEYRDGTRAVFTPSRDNPQLGDKPSCKLAAFRLDEALGFELMPLTVSAKHNGITGVTQYYVKGNPTLPLFPNSSRSTLPSRVELFDFLIANLNWSRGGQTLITKDGNVVATARGFSFLLNAPPTKPREIERVKQWGRENPDIIERLRSTDNAQLRSLLGEYLARNQIEALIQRKNWLVAQFQGVDLTGSPREMLTPTDLVNKTFASATVPTPHFWEERGADSFLRGDFGFSEQIDGKTWSVGVLRGNAHRSIHFLNPSSGLEQKQFLLFMDVLRQGGLKTLDDSQVALSLHVQTEGEPLKHYQIVDLSRYSLTKAKLQLFHAQKHLPQDFRRFVLEQYRKRLKIPEQDLRRLQEISERTEGRTILLVKTEDPYVLFRGSSMIQRSDSKLTLPPEDAFKSEEVQMPEHFNISGGAMIVSSSSAAEPLPLELFTGFRVPRPKNGRIIEIGRYTVSRDQVTEVSPRIVQQLASVATGMGDVKKIVIEADEARARSFGRYGFKSIHQRLNYNGKIEHIMEVTPETLLTEVIAKDYPDESLDQILNSTPNRTTR